MRANQPMGLSQAAADLVAPFVRIDSGRTYEGYWDEQFPLADYLAPRGQLAHLVREREALEQRLAHINADIEAEGRALVAARSQAYSEYEQATLYSSGPVMFLALRGPDGEPVEASLWSECGMEVASEGRCYCAGRVCQPDCPFVCLESGQEPAPPLSPDDNDWANT